MSEQVYASGNKTKQGRKDPMLCLCRETREVTTSGAMAAATRSHEVAKLREKVAELVDEIAKLRQENTQLHQRLAAAAASHASTAAAMDSTEQTASGGGVLALLSVDG